MGRQTGDVKSFAVSLLNIADDEGYFIADPSLVRAEVLPFENDLDVIHGLLTECSVIGWLQLREHSREGVIGYLPNFTDHQKINRPTPSKLVKYWEESTLIICEQLQEDILLTEPSLSANGALMEHSSQERKGREGKGNNNSAPARNTCSYSKEFEKFRNEYPGHRRGGKWQDWKSWQVAKRAGMTAEQAHEYLSHWKQSPKWKKDGGTYIVALSKWLRDGYWDTQPADYEPSTSAPGPNGNREAVQAWDRVYGRVIDHKDVELTDRDKKALNNIGGSWNLQRCNADSISHKRRQFIEFWWQLGSDA